MTQEEKGGGVAGSQLGERGLPTKEVGQEAQRLGVSCHSKTELVVKDWSGSPALELWPVSLGRLRVSPGGSDSPRVSLLQAFLELPPPFISPRRSFESRIPQPRTSRGCS